jgi:type I restriction enzyme S subunit
LTLRADGIDPLYLGYFVKSKQSIIEGMAEGSTGQTEMNKARLSTEVVVTFPSELEAQKVIASFLLTIDRKIAINYRTNDYLLQLATAMFEGALEIERREESFADIVELEDSKRIPLNSRDREQRKGPYPYYGATSIMGYVDDFLFDGTRVLLGEDGSVITDDGRPVLQYVWGKYWVNNHAHILKPSAEYSLEMLYIALSRTSIPHIVTGAVQKKISQKNLNTLVLEMPNPQHMEGLGEIFSLYRANVDQNKQLERLRDTLLPKLMSGEIDVSQVELPAQPNNHLS